MHILLIGGGLFLGAATLHAALARGHRVTVFNRGRACSAWPDGVEVVTGDRRTDMPLLAGRTWDAVVDTCGYVPAELATSTQALATCGRYLFVSSVSAYATTHQVPVREADPLASAAGIAADDRDMRHYGAQKAACEALVTGTFGERALIVRPGLIAGPGDRSGRFSHWPWRLRAGGTMLVPDVPPGAPLQFIDVRDLGDWMVGLLEQQAPGAFNATGPAQAPACDWPALLAACRAEALARGVTPADVVPVSEAFLTAQGVQPWSELPLWLPSDDTGYRGFSRVDLSRAIATGLRSRPLRETVSAVMDEPLPAPDDPRRAGRLGREREAALLAAWASSPH